MTAESCTLFQAQNHEAATQIAERAKGGSTMPIIASSFPAKIVKPIKPSFLIEVMALECLRGGWGGSHPYEIQGLFATLADRIHDEWKDPAGLGPAISNGMDAARKDRAKKLLSAHSEKLTWP